MHGKCKEDFVKSSIICLFHDFKRRSSVRLKLPFRTLCAYAIDGRCGFAVATSGQAFGGDASRNQVIHGTLRTGLRERKVEIIGAATVGMRIKLNADARIATQEFGKLVERRHCVGANIGFAIIVINVF